MMQNVEPTAGKITGYDVMKFLEHANLDQLENVMICASARLYVLSNQHSSMKEANLYQAAEYLLDGAKNVHWVIHADDPEVCKCGKCDSCVAARSDELHDRTTDGILTKGDK